MFLLESVILMGMLTREYCLSYRFSFEVKLTPQPFNPFAERQQEDSQHRGHLPVSGTKMEVLQLFSYRTLNTKS